MAKKSTTEIWQELPDELLLKSVAKLSSRPLSRMRLVCKRWNEMFSSPESLKTMFPDRSSPSCVFLLQFSPYGSEGIQSWIIEGDADFYRVPSVKFPEYCKCIEVVCNNIYLCSKWVRDGPSNFYIFNKSDSSTATWTEVPRPSQITTTLGTDFIATAFVSSINQHIILLGQYYWHTNSRSIVEIYDSKTNSWIQTFVEHSYFPLGRGFYSQGRFYWLRNYSNNGEVIEFNWAEKSWTVIPSPADTTADYPSAVGFPSEEVQTKLYEKHYDVMIHWRSFTASWELAGCDDYVVLVDKEYHQMWKLDKEDGEERKKWSLIHINLPQKIYRIAVNNNGYILVVGEKVSLYNNEGRIIRTIELAEFHPQLLIQTQNYGNYIPFFGMAVDSTNVVWWP